MKLLMALFMKIVLITPVLLRAESYPKESFWEGEILSVLDLDMESLPLETSIFQEFIEKLCYAQADIICLRKIDSEAMTHAFFDKLVEVYLNTYLEEDALIFSKYRVEDPRSILAQTAQLIEENNVFVAIKNEDETEREFNFGFKFLTYAPERISITPDPFFDQHPFIYQEGAIILLCRGGGSISGGRDRDGNVKGNAEVHYERDNDHGTFSGRVEGSVSKDRHGETNGEVKGTIGFEWD